MKETKQTIRHGETGEVTAVSSDRRPRKRDNAEEHQPVTEVEMLGEVLERIEARLHARAADRSDA
jgi:hypothetical protein